VWWAGVWTLFALAVMAMSIPFLAEQGKGLKRHAAAWIMQYPVLMLVLFAAAAVPWWWANYHPNKGMNEIYSTSKQQTISRLVQFALAITAFVWQVIKVRMMVGAGQGE
jgi:hypothetical protein